MEIRLYQNPKGRKPTASRIVPLEGENVRQAIRTARKELRAEWAGLPDYNAKDIVRVGVYNAQGKLEYQAHIDGDSALNGFRRMIVVEER